VLLLGPPSRADLLLPGHVPTLFALGVRFLKSGIRSSKQCFLGTGLLFWWPVYSALAKHLNWAAMVVTFCTFFLATLPCDVLSGFLAFSDRVAYPVVFFPLRGCLAFPFWKISSVRPH